MTIASVLSSVRPSVRALACLLDGAPSFWSGAARITSPINMLTPLYSLPLTTEDWVRLSMEYDLRTLEEDARVAWEQTVREMTGKANKK